MAVVYGGAVVVMVGSKSTAVAMAAGEKGLSYKSHRPLHADVHKRGNLAGKTPRLLPQDLSHRTRTFRVLVTIFARCTAERGHCAASQQRVRLRIFAGPAHLLQRAYLWLEPDRYPCEGLGPAGQQPLSRRHMTLALEGKLLGAQLGPFVAPRGAGPRTVLQGTSFCGHG